MASLLVTLLATLVAVQFFVIFHLLHARHANVPHDGLGVTTTNNNKAPPPPPVVPPPAPVTLSVPVPVPAPPLLDGVAVTIFMGSPKWFQDRYTIMVNQVLTSLPPTWKVQIFYIAGKPMAVEGTRYPGIQKLVRRGRVVLTPFPSEFFRLKKKDVMLQPWLWRSMLADRVLLFGGSTVLCANAADEINAFADMDFLGGPWGAYKGHGGDGALSLRNRTLMVQALETVILEAGAVGAGGALVRRPKAPYAKREEAAFLDAMRIAAPEANVAVPADTRRFVATEGWWDGVSRPFGGVGTLAGLNHTTRQQFLNYCPEIKMCVQQAAALAPPLTLPSSPATGCFQCSTTRTASGPSPPRWAASKPCASTGASAARKRC
jgi:hypothetical protein